ncbi:hypothetical protein HDU96_011135 [Phlyctochytrium bullatum]|nr:hypothetical protein HDU96_011135 [Phlyctochytrium bullatum]
MDTSPATPSNRPIVAILGAGLIGGYLGAALATSPASFPPEIHLVGRPSFADKVRAANGLTLTLRTNAASVPKTRHADHPTSFHLHTSLANLRAALPRAPDFLAVCVKRTQSDAAADELASVGFTSVEMEREAAAAGENGESAWYWRNTTLITLQNGARAAQQFRDRLGESIDIIDGMWPFNVVEPEPAHYHQGTVGPVYVADTEKGRAFMKILLAAGVDCKVSLEMENVSYGKLLLNLNNAVCALSALPIRAELSKREFRDILARCISEALAVYTAAGIHPAPFTSVPLWMLPYVLALPDFAFLRIASSMLAMDEKATSSMYEDLKAGKPTEIEYLQGEVARLGLEHHVPTPVCDRVVGLVRAVEKRKEGLVPHSGEQVLDTLELL